jgi:GT2 family glycosyltransferase
MKISVIVLVYNGAKYLPNLINSLIKTDWPSKVWEVIFIDNASSDDGLEIIRKSALPNSSVIRSSVNVGYAAGNNVGIKQALESNSDYIVLLNQDTVVDTNWLNELVSTADTHDDAGAVQSLLLHWDNKNLVNSWGNYIHFLGFGFAGGNKEVLSERLNVDVVTYCSGAAVIYKASVLRQVGLLDETLESYHDDLDMGLRLRLNGYKSYLAPNSIVYHKYRFLNHDKLGKRKYYLMERNRLYILFKYYSLKTLWLIFPAWLVVEIGIFLFSIVRGFWPEKLKGYAWVILNFKLLMLKRREIRNNIKMGDRKMAHDFVGWINYQEINNPLLRWIANPLMRGYWTFVKQLI